MPNSPAPSILAPAATNAPHPVGPLPSVAMKLEPVVTDWQGVYNRYCKSLSEVYESPDNSTNTPGFEAKVYRLYSKLENRAKKEKFAYHVASEYQSFEPVIDLYKQNKFSIRAADFDGMMRVFVKLSAKNLSPRGRLFEKAYKAAVNINEFAKKKKWANALGAVGEGFGAAVELYGYKDAAEIFIEHLKPLSDQIGQYMKSSKDRGAEKVGDIPVGLRDLYLKAKIYNTYFQFLLAGGNTPAFKKVLNKITDKGEYLAPEGDKLALFEKTYFNSFFRVLGELDIKDNIISFKDPEGDKPEDLYLMEIHSFLKDFNILNEIHDALSFDMNMIELLARKQIEGEKILPIFIKIFNIKRLGFLGEELRSLEELINLARIVKNISIDSPLQDDGTFARTFGALVVTKQVVMRQMHDVILRHSDPKLIILPLDIKVKKAVEKLADLFEQCAVDMRQNLEVLKDIESPQGAVAEVSRASAELINMPENTIDMSKKNIAVILGYIDQTPETSMDDRTLSQAFGLLPASNFSPYLVNSQLDWFRMICQEMGKDFKFVSYGKEPEEILKFILLSNFDKDEGLLLLKESKFWVEKFYGIDRAAKFDYAIKLINPLPGFIANGILSLISIGATSVYFMQKYYSNRAVEQAQPGPVAEEPRRESAASNVIAEITEEDHNKMLEEKRRKEQLKDAKESYRELMEAKDRLAKKDIDISFDNMRKNYDSLKKEFRDLLILRHKYQYAYYSPSEKKGIAKAGSEKAVKNIRDTHEALKKYADSLNVKGKYEESYEEVKLLYKELEEELTLIEEGKEDYRKYSLLKSEINALHATLNDHIKNINETPVPDMSTIYTLVLGEGESVSGEGESHARGIERIKCFSPTPKEIATDTIIGTFPTGWKNFYEIAEKDLIREKIDFTSAAPIQPQPADRFERKPIKPEAAPDQNPARANKQKNNIAKKYRELFIGSNPFIHSLCTNFDKLQDLLKNPSADEEIYVRAMRYYIMRIAGALCEAARREDNSRSQIVPLNGGDEKLKTPLLMKKGSFEVMNNLRNGIMHSHDNFYFNADKLKKIADDLSKKLSESIDKITKKCNTAQPPVDFSKPSFVLPELNGETKIGSINTSLGKELAFLRANLENYSQDPQAKAAVIMALTTIGEISTPSNRRTLFGREANIEKYAERVRLEIRDKTAHIFGNKFKHLQKYLAYVTERGDEIFHIYYDYYINPIKEEKDWKTCIEPVSDELLEELLDKKMIEALSKSKDRDVASLLTSAAAEKSLPQPEGDRSVFR